jgi:hypothetical protein
MVAYSENSMVGDSSGCCYHKGFFKIDNILSGDFFSVIWCSAVEIPYFSLLEVMVVSPFQFV